MACVIYTRVSTLSQNVYNQNVSLDVQEKICTKFAHENKLKVKSIYKEVHSAFGRAPKILRNIINQRHKIIVFSCVDRFSRNVEVGLQLAVLAFKNKNKLVFVNEKFVCETPGDLLLLKTYLKKTEQESKTIGYRIKQSKNYLIDKGLFAGGYIPYGYCVKERQLVDVLQEQVVLEFIKLCRRDEILTDDLNQLMCLILETTEFTQIACYDKYNNVITKMTEPLNFAEIAELLNSYDVKKRNKCWTCASVKTALNSYTPKTFNCETKMDNWSDMKDAIDNAIDNAINIQQKVNTPNQINHAFKFNMATSPKAPLIVNNMEVDLGMPVLRRSSRLNQDTSTDETSIEMDDDIEMKSDTQLFKQFAEFQKFKKFMNK